MRTSDWIWRIPRTKLLLIDTNKCFYDASGNILAGSSANNKIGFQTKPYEGSDIGLYYSRARYYDPAVGRFISSDPIGFEGGINLYVYAGNNPVNWVDPEGEAANKKTIVAGTVEIVVGVGAAITGVTTAVGAGAAIAPAIMGTYLFIEGTVTAVVGVVNVVGGLFGQERIEIQFFFPGPYVLPSPNQIKNLNPCER